MLQGDLSSEKQHVSGHSCPRCCPCSTIYSLFLDSRSGSPAFCSCNGCWHAVSPKFYCFALLPTYDLALLED
uniref:Uncharacterized protein n=1 Tax=Arundo donax TaxID=35708 RepID=A0A0A9FDI2_ARUDO